MAVAVTNPSTFDPRLHPRGAFETIDRVLCGAGGALSAGRRYLMYFTALNNNAFSNLDIVTGAGAASGITAARMGLYTVASSGDCTLACQTANDVTIGAAANTEYSRALDTTGGFPASYSLVRGNRYAASFYFTASTTLPTILAFTGNTTLMALAPRMIGFDNSGSGTDLNTTVTNANISTAFAVTFYLAGL